MLAQYDVYLALPSVYLEEHEDMGIITKNIAKATEVMERLDRDLGLNPSALSPIEDAEVTPLLKCIVAGQIDQLWTVESDGTAIHLANKQKRELSSSTVVTHPKLVAGTPFDLQIPTHEGGLDTLHLVQNVTAVDPAWLEAMAPHLFKVRPGKIYFDSQQGTLATRQLVKFNGHTIEGSSTPITDSTKRYGRMFTELYAAWVYEQLERERRYLSKGHGKRVPAVPLRQLQQQVQAITRGAISLERLSPQQRTELTALGKMQTHLGDAYMARLKAPTRGNYRPEQHTRKQWQPRHKRKYER